MERESESEVAQSCLTLCDPVDCSPPNSSVHGILQARSGLPFPSPGDLPDPGMEPRSPALQADALTSEPSATITNHCVARLKVIIRLQTNYASIKNLIANT